MAITWSNPKAINPPVDGAVRAALATCTTGTEANTAGATDGLDLRGLGSVEVHLETVGAAQGTIRINGMLPGDTVTVNGQVFTAVAPGTNPSAVQFPVAVVSGPDRGNDWITAANLANAINANGVGASVGAFVSQDEAIVTVFALTDGAGGNAFNLLTSSARAVVSGATLSGGLAAGAIAPNASLQAYLKNPVTGRWERAIDYDIPLTAALVNEAKPPFPVRGGGGRLQMLPNGVGVACFVYLVGFGGRIP